MSGLEAAPVMWPGTLGGRPSGVNLGPTRHKASCHRASDVSVDDSDRARPACGTAAHLHWKAAHYESLGRQRFEIVQLLDVAIADLAAGLVAFPDQAGVAGGKIFLPGVDEGR